MTPEDEVIRLLKSEGLDTVMSVPCDRVKNLLALVSLNFFHIPLTREEEGVGIAAGLALASKKPLMLVQSSGIGNMANALCSLTKVYELPLPILVSWRGVYKENIVAQVPMGKCLPRLLESMDVPFVTIESSDDIPKIRTAVRTAFKENKISVALLSPCVWEESTADVPRMEPGVPRRKKRSLIFEGKAPEPQLTRFQVIRHIAPYLQNKNVVVNIGAPCKEVYAVADQASNFYMLGSLGMASPIGLGLALGCRKDVVVIDGDGSILMNPNILCTISQCQPRNLTIICIDNGVHGSTGSQPTASSSLDLELLAKSFGIRETAAAWDGRTLDEALDGKGVKKGRTSRRGTLFVHVIAKPGNEPVPDIPMTPLEIKMRFTETLKPRRSACRLP